jgi:hypothetical protein
MITQSYLKAYLVYRPETGEFFAKSDNGRFKAGRRLGTLHSIGYEVIRIEKKLYKSHRLAWLYMTGSFPKQSIDHINRVKNDNRWLNLREVSQSQNSENNPMKRSNSSGFVGVGYSKKLKKWRSRIMYGYKEVHLGYFDSPESAHDAYCVAAAKYHTLNPYAKTQIL